MKHYMGIDPGYSGAIVVIDEDGGFVGSVRLSATEHDVSSFVIEHAPTISRATLERARARCAGDRVSRSERLKPSAWAALS